MITAMIKMEKESIIIIAKLYYLGYVYVMIEYADLI